MRRLTYQPQIRAYINITSGNSDPQSPSYNPNFGKTVDISDDIINGSLTLKINALSTLSLKLQNKNGKYLGGYKNGNNEASSGYIFTPMDRIVLSLSRIGEPFQVFSGYLDSVPAFQLFPDAVDISASCTLKRLNYTFFDPGLPSMISYFAQRGGYAYDPNTGILSDPLARFGTWGVYGGAGELLASVMEDIGSWPSETIYIKSLPDTFIQAIQSATGNFQSSSAFTPAGVTPVGVVSSSSLSDKSYTYIGFTELQGQTSLDLRWIDDLLDRIGAPKSVQNRNFLFAWWRGEGGGGLSSGGGYGGTWSKNTANFNWLNTTRGTEYPTINSVGVRAFPSYGVGLSVTIDTFKQEATGPGNYGPYIIPALKTGDPYRNSSTILPGLVAWLAGSYSGHETTYSHNIMSYYSTPTLISSSTPKLDVGNNTILGIASSQVGITENPPGSNGGPEVDQYLSSVGLGTDHYWCAAFVYWTLSKAGLATSTFTSQAGLGLVKNMWDALPESQKHRSPFLPRPGDLVFYSFGKTTPSHVGFVESVNSDGTFNTIEGNSGKDWKPGVQISVAKRSGISRLNPDLYGFGRVTTLPWKIGGSLSQSISGLVASSPSELGSSISVSQGSDSLANGSINQQLSSTNSTLSYLLTGDHALANDIPLIDWVKDFVAGAGRVFCSAPNGDFYAFFPDYFGWFGTTPYFRISDIEIVDLQVQLTDSDTNFATHVYGVGPLIGYTQISLVDYASSAVASVQSPAFSSFIKTNTTVNPGPSTPVSPQDIIQDFSASDWNPAEFLARYGARPLMKEFSNIRNPSLLWMATWLEFMKGWASRYKSSASFTFLPELFPGGRVNIADRLVMYIESVNHNFDYTNGFTTSAELSAASVGSGDLLEGESQRTLVTGTQVGG